jgi:hypothetical protein
MSKSASIQFSDRSPDPNERLYENVPLKYFIKELQHSVRERIYIQAPIKTGGNLEWLRIMKTPLVETLLQAKDKGDNSTFKYKLVGFTDLYIMT